MTPEEIKAAILDLAACYDDKPVSLWDWSGWPKDHAFCECQSCKGGYFVKFTVTNGTGTIESPYCEACRGSR